MTAKIKLAANGPYIKAPKTFAGGIPAIVSTLKHSLHRMNFVRATLALSRVNQESGFDCPGCAWPDPPAGEKTISEFCENGAKAVADEATKKVIADAFFAQHRIEDLREQSDYWLNEQGRLSRPMYKPAASAHYQPISWPEAFALIGKRLSGLDDPNKAVFYTSGRTSNEAAFLYQLMVRLLGSNNLPDCSNLCHESSGVALKESLGSGKGSVLLEDFQHADAIFVIGQNPGTNHPRMLTALQDAKRRGAKIVTINPLKEAGLLGFIHPQEVHRLFAQPGLISDLYLQPRINGDVAVLKGIMKHLIAADQASPVLDHSFIETYTEGFTAFRENLSNTSWQEIEAASALTKDQLFAAAEIARQANSIITCWAMGLTQHVNAVANIQEIVNFMLLRGQIGRKGAGLCPVRGHSNVQGDRTMGIWEKPEPAFLDRLGKRFSFSPPRRAGYDVTASIEAMLGGKVEVFISMGGNFISASPDTEQTIKAMRNTALSVQISTKLNRSHLETGKEALILPCLGRSEIDVQKTGPQFVTVENSMGVVHKSQGQRTPPSPHLKSEPAIVAGMAEANLGSIPVDWQSLCENYDLIRDLIADVIDGFDDFNARVRRPGGITLAHPNRDQRSFPTNTGKAKFSCHQIPPDSLQQGELMLMTLRSHDQYNTTIYGLNDRYRGIFAGRKIIMMNADDMRERGLAQGQLVDIESKHEGKTRQVSRFFAIPYDIPRRCAASYFPETNPLVPLELKAVKSLTPASKSIPITVTPTALGALE